MAKILSIISGRGSNLAALIKAGIPINTVISNKQDVAGLKIAGKARIESHYIQDIHDFIPFIKNHDIICLAGFMKILPPNAICNKMVNIHPSLLPKFPGLGAQSQAFNIEQYTGCTTHLVTPEMDGGPILSQKIVKIEKDDTVDILTNRILLQEHILYPNTIKMILKNMDNIFVTKKLKLPNSIISPGYLYYQNEIICSSKTWQSGKPCIAVTPDDSDEIIQQRLNRLVIMDDSRQAL